MKQTLRTDANDNVPGLTLGQLRAFLAQVDGAPDDTLPRVRTRMAFHAQGGHIRSIAVELDDGGVLP